jgi:hypothetical protein
LFLLKLPIHKKNLKNYKLIFKIIYSFFNILFSYLKFINKLKNFKSWNKIGDEGSASLGKGIGKLKQLTSLTLNLW